MKNFLNNKFNLIIILLVAIVLGFSNSVFANYDFTYNDNTYSLDIENIITNFNNYDYHFIYQENSNRIYIILFSTKPTLYRNGSNLCFNASRMYCLNLDYYYNDPMNLFKSEISDPRGYIIDTNWFYYCDFDFLDPNGNVVFQRAPQEQAQELTLVPIVEQAEMEKTMAEILGILPLVVSLLVSIIAIRKAISFLRNVLKTS